MSAARKLHLVKDQPTVEDELRSLLRARERVRREAAAIDAGLRLYGRAYADERGEIMLPTVERLTRDLLA